MSNVIQQAQTAGGVLFSCASAHMSAFYEFVLRTIIQNEVPSQENANALAAATSALNASHSNVDSAGNGVFDPCPSTCGSGLSTAAGNLVDALFAEASGSYSGTGTYSQFAQQVMASWNANVNAKIGAVHAAFSNINQHICACDMEATGGQYQAENSCYNGAPVGGGPAPNTNWWHTSSADCPNWHPGSNPHQCWCFEDPM